MLEFEAVVFSFITAAQFLAAIFVISNRQKLYSGS
jgi:hypothetical protein